ncbi:MAG: hypothetical protein AAF333_10705 [Planctomycetota bacterium]
MKPFFSLLSVALLTMPPGCMQNPAPVEQPIDPPGVVFLFGQFDLDYDGQTDDFGGAIAASMVERAGYTVSDELNDDVDWVLIGIEPPLPRPPS